MSVISSFEDKVEGAVDGAAAAVFASPIEPAQIAKKAEKQMKKEKLVGSGKQYAPTLYNVLVNAKDDKRLFGFYPTMASEIENYLYAKGTEAGMEFDTRPLVRFIPDPKLKKGRFDVIAEVVAAPTIRKLRDEELEYYGLAPVGAPSGAAAAAAAAAQAQAGAAAAAPYAGAQAPQQAARYPQHDPQSGRSPQPTDSKFRGLDVPAVISNSYPDSSELPPLSLGRAAPGAIQSPVAGGAVAGGAAAGGAFAAGGAAAVGGAALAGGAAMAGGAGVSRGAHAARDIPAVNPAAGSAAQGAPYAGVEQEPLSVIGTACLFNCVEQQSFRLRHRKLTVGRGKENDITVADANASRVHARFSQDATGKWKVTDLGSTNGTQLNGRPVSSAILRSGDEVTIGTTVFQFTE